MNAEVPCPVCGERVARPATGAADSGLAVAAIGSGRTEVAAGTVVRCGSCGLGFRVLRPHADDLAALYHDLDSTAYEAEEPGRRRTAARHLAIVQRIASPGSLLDVGCASGLFLEAAARAGWSVTGVEPSEALAALARRRLGEHGVVATGTLESAHFESAPFDVVTLWDVLEHVPDPTGFLRICAGLLVPGGYLFAHVPDIDSVQARLLGKRWPLLLPEHLSYFTHASLRLCGERAGLRWIGAARRPASFSVSYVLHRLEQHGIPGAVAGMRVASAARLEHRIIALPMGELLGVWQH